MPGMQDIFTIHINYTLQLTHGKRREQVTAWEQEGTERMVHTCLHKFPALQEERFMLLEVAEMYKKEVSDLKVSASATLKTITNDAKSTQQEVH